MDIQDYRLKALKGLNKFKAAYVYYRTHEDTKELSNAQIAVRISDLFELTEPNRLDKRDVDNGLKNLSPNDEKTIWEDLNLENADYHHGLRSERYILLNNQYGSLIRMLHVEEADLNNWPNIRYKTESVQPRTPPPPREPSREAPPPPPKEEPHEIYKRVVQSGKTPRNAPKDVIFWIGDGKSEKKKSYIFSEKTDYRIGIILGLVIMFFFLKSLVTGVPLCDLSGILPNPPAAPTETPQPSHSPAVSDYCLWLRKGNAVGTVIEGSEAFYSCKEAGYVLHQADMDEACSYYRGYKSFYAYHSDKEFAASWVCFDMKVPSPTPKTALSSPETPTIKTTPTNSPIYSHQPDVKKYCEIKEYEKVIIYVRKEGEDVVESLFQCDGAPAPIYQDEMNDVCNIGYSNNYYAYQKDKSLSATWICYQKNMPSPTP